MLPQCGLSGFDESINCYGYQSHHTLSTWPQTQHLRLEDWLQWSFWTTNPRPRPYWRGCPSADGQRWTVLKAETPWNGIRAVCSILNRSLWKPHGDSFQILSLRSSDWTTHTVKVHAGFYVLVFHTYMCLCCKWRLSCLENVAYVADLQSLLQAKVRFTGKQF